MQKHYKLCQISFLGPIFGRALRASGLQSADELNVESKELWSRMRWDPGACWHWEAEAGFLDGTHSMEPIAHTGAFWDTIETVAKSWENQILGL